jgi:hypothetical protein
MRVVPQFLKTPFERWKALFDGYILVDSVGTKAYIDNGLPVIEDSNGDKGDLLYYLDGSCERWTIWDPRKQVKEKPSLTYEQALDCKRIKINIPYQIYPEFRISKHTDGTFDPIAILLIDLAERRGYRIEKID